MATCADNPSGAACQKAQNEANAVALAMASTGLIYLPGGMQVTGAIGATANAGVQYFLNGTVNPTDVLIASYVGAFTKDTALWGTVGWNAAGGATSNYLKGDDPMIGAGWGALGAGIGYLGGTYLIKTPLDKIVNPVSKSYEWVDIGMGITKPLTPSSIPGIMDNTSGAFLTEASGQDTPKFIENLKEKMKDEK